MGLLGGKNLANRSKRGLQAQDEVGEIHHSSGNLYKRGFSTPILKCMGKEDANYVLREVHEGICGNHIRARSLATKTLRQGYYWPTILKNGTELVKKCKIYQEHAQIPHLPSESLSSITSP